MIPVKSFVDSPGLCLPGEATETISELSFILTLSGPVANILAFIF
jgi:hypothetical protein